MKTYQFFQFILGFVGALLIMKGFGAYSDDHSAFSMIFFGAFMIYGAKSLKPKNAEEEI